MTRIALLTALLLLVALPVSAEPGHHPPAEPAYTVVFLRAAPETIENDDPELRKAHHAYLNGLVEQGALLAAGGLDGEGGLMIYRAPLEEARALAEADPAVQGGALVVEAKSWALHLGALAPGGEGGGTQPAGHGKHGGGHGKHGGGHGKAHTSAGGDHATVHHRFEDAERWAAVFDSPDRDEWQKPVDLVRAMKLKKGSVVADIGAGTGYFNPHLAKAVGGKGRVLAVDVEPNLVVHMALRALRERTHAVEPILGGFADPRLPAGEVDVVLLVDTYHHIDARKDYFARLKTAMRPGGRLVVVDFKPGDIPVGPPEQHRIPSEQVDAELEEAGWRPAEVKDDLLPYQFVHIYEMQ